MEQPQDNKNQHFFALHVLELMAASLHTERPYEWVAEGTYMGVYVLPQSGSQRTQVPTRDTAAHTGRLVT